MMQNVKKYFNHISLLCFSLLICFKCLYIYRVVLLQHDVVLVIKKRYFRGDMKMCSTMFVFTDNETFAICWNIPPSFLYLSKFVLLLVTPTTKYTNNNDANNTSFNNSYNNIQYVQSSSLLMVQSEMRWITSEKIDFGKRKIIAITFRYF